MTHNAKKIRMIFFGAILLSCLVCGAFLSSRSRKNPEENQQIATLPTTRPAAGNGEISPGEKHGDASAVAGTPASLVAGTNVAAPENFLRDQENGFSGKSESAAKFFLADGDLYDIYGGGRDFVQSDEKGAIGRDSRIWIDARVPVEISSRLKLYGVSTLTLGDAETLNTLDDYRRSYGIGGGFGFTYSLFPDTELNFDFRRSLPVESQTNDAETTDSAGISIKVRF